MSAKKLLTYRNRTDRDLVVMGVGRVKANGTIKTSKVVISPNLEIISKINLKLAPLKQPLKR